MSEIPILIFDNNAEVVDKAKENIYNLTKKQAFGTTKIEEVYRILKEKKIKLFLCDFNLSPQYKFHGHQVIKRVRRKLRFNIILASLNISTLAMSPSIVLYSQASINNIQNLGLSSNIEIHDQIPDINTFTTDVIQNNFPEMISTENRLDNPETLKNQLLNKLNNFENKELKIWINGKKQISVNQLIKEVINESIIGEEYLEDFKKLSSL